jgi:hypothetical protein
MKIADAVASFAEWSYPWTFNASVRGKLGDYPEELTKFDAMFLEASNPDHWQLGDLVLGCKIAQKETKEKFPDMPNEIVTAMVRAASYEWR